MLSIVQYLPLGDVRTSEYLSVSIISKTLVMFTNSMTS